MEKIVLIHGWDYEQYTHLNDKNAWANRDKIINALSDLYEVELIKLPGFCGQKEPKDKSWGVEDYAEFVEQNISKMNKHPDFVMGYSFGGAVTLKWKLQYKKNTPIILDSPAILRATSNKNIHAKYCPESLKVIKNILRDIYLVHVVNNPEMKYGTKFLRNTYQRIVRVDMSQQLCNIQPNEVKLIFGDQDTMVPPQLLKNKIKGNPVENRISIIKNGGHDIAVTHTEQFLNIFNEYIKEFKSS